MSCQFAVYDIWRDRNASEIVKSNTLCILTSLGSGSGFLASREYVGFSKRQIDLLRDSGVL